MTAIPVLAALAALAHAPSHPKKIVVAVTPRFVVVDIVVEIAVGERARTLRTLFDTNRDRVVSVDEETRLANYLAERAKRSLIVHLNDQRLVFANETRLIDGARGAVDASQSIILRLALVSDPVRIRFGANHLKVADAGFERANDIPVALSLGIRGAVTSARADAVLSARGESTTFRFRALEHPRSGRTEDQ